MLDDLRLTLSSVSIIKGLGKMPPCIFSALQGSYVVLNPLVFN